jgi:hypothetical protein
MDNYNVETEWNSNMVIIRILAELRVKIIDCCLDKDYENYYNHLDQYWSQLYGVVKDKKDREFHEKRRKEVRKSMWDIKKAEAKGITVVSIELVEDFKTWEKELYATQQKYNLGLSLKEDPGLAAMKT